MNLKRENYLQMIRPYYDVDLIKVITGVRRAGKSVLLNTIKEELLENGVDEEHIIYFNLEDLDFAYIKSALDLHEAVKSRIDDKGKYYVFLDEIQHIGEFEKALASLRNVNVSLFVTGSNSTLLSGELATLLTGRTVEFEVFPFSFYEMAEYYKLNNWQFAEEKFYDYLKWGGFPLRFQFQTEGAVKKYISTLYESIVGRDIIGPKMQRDKQLFLDISLYILANAGKEFSAERIAEYYQNKFTKKVAVRTIYNYLERMKKAYLLHGVKKYYLSGKNCLGNREKYYAVDMGFRTINTNTIDYEDTFFLENIIYNELLSRGYTVFTGKTYRGEVDFVVIKEGKKCFIQVAYILGTAETVEREFGAFKQVRDASPKYVLSLDKIDLSHEGIIHLNIIDFLLHRRELLFT